MIMDNSLTHNYYHLSMSPHASDVYLFLKLKFQTRNYNRQVT